MNELLIVRAGFFTTIQDRGRFGYRSQAVCTCGALDGIAFELANAMCGNHGGEAALEIPYGNATFEFTDARCFAVAGADVRATLDGTLVPPWSSSVARAGQRLVLHEATHGVRSILAIAGGVAVPEVLGSRSTDVRAGFGGMDGRPLQDGDRVTLGTVDATPARTTVHVKPPQWIFDVRTIGVVPASEYDGYDAHQQRAFWGGSWTVEPQSDRMGLRLHGDALRGAARDRPAVRSHAVFPGVIQLPPAGQPIVLLNDAPTTGGYPNIGVVRKADLWKLAQAPAGMQLRFVQSTIGEAEAALQEIDQYVERVKQAVIARRSG